MLLLRVAQVIHMSSVTVQFNLNSVVAGALLHLYFIKVIGFSLIECNHNSTLSPIHILYIIVNKGGTLAAKKPTMFE